MEHNAENRLAEETTPQVETGLDPQTSAPWAQSSKTEELDGAHAQQSVTGFRVLPKSREESRTAFGLDDVASVDPSSAPSTPPDPAVTVQTNTTTCGGALSHLCVGRGWHSWP